ncbi:MAG: DNA gyrase inhibitor YacG [Bdellovibrionota bacterium]
MQVPCPKCRKLVEYHGNEFRPFCSERCRVIDLGDWADGKYAIPLYKTENDDIEDREEKNSEEDQE